MKLFEKKTVMEKLETTLAQFQQRAAALGEKRAAAETALAAATAARQQHRLEGDLADEKLDAKLQADVDACRSKLNGLDTDIAVLQEKVAQTERQLADERTAAARKAASDTLARNLAAVEQELPGYLEACQRLVGALEELHHDFAATQMAGFLAKQRSEVETASAFMLDELRRAVHGILNGSVAIPASKPAPMPVIVAAPPPETRWLFALREVQWRDATGQPQHAMQHTNCCVPPAAASRGLRCGALIPLDDPRCKELRKARAGYHIGKRTALDLDDEAACRPAHIEPIMRSDPARGASFMPLDRGATFKIATPGPQV